MLNIVLFEPEIPQNTGNIARTCAVTGARLHLIKPLGFDISDKAVKRAGLDYWHLVDVRVYENLDDFFAKTGATDLWLATTKAPRDASSRAIALPIPRDAPVTTAIFPSNMIPTGRPHHAPASFFLFFMRSDHPTLAPHQWQCSWYSLIR